MPDCLPAQDKDIVGWIEKVKIYSVGEDGLFLKAKLDTGAKSSALHAVNVTKFKRSGKDWVKFTLNDKKGESVTIEKEIVRTTMVKRKNSKPEERVVILIGICVGSAYKTGEVSLADRSNLNYPVLLGRAFLKGSFIIDPGETFTHKPVCKGISKK